MISLCMHCAALLKDGCRTGYIEDMSTNNDILRVLTFDSFRLIPYGSCTDYGDSLTLENFLGPTTMQGLVLGEILPRTFSGAVLGSHVGL